MSTTLLEENRALKHALAERDERIAELQQKIARIAGLEQEIEELRVELRGAARDRAKLEARLKELLAKRRALTEAVAPGQMALVFGEDPVPTPPCAKEAPDGETSADKIRPRHVRRGAPRETSYAALQREHVQHELPLAERVCPVTEKDLVPVGEKTTEERASLPATRAATGSAIPLPQPIPDCRFRSSGARWASPNAHDGCRVRVPKDIQTMRLAELVAALRSC